MRYYSTQRPVAPGSYPNRERVEAIHNFDTKTFCGEIGREAWGYIEYREAPTKEQAEAYELTLGGMKTYWCVTTSADDKGRIIANITGTIEAVSKPESSYKETNRRDIYNDWFESREEAQAMYDIVIALLLFGGFVALMVFMGYKGYTRASVAKRATESVARRLGATMTATLKHTEGLPLAKGIPVEVYYSPEKVVFKKDRQEISIARSKITGIDCVFGKDVKAQQVAGAAAGKYILGGMTGAVIGSLAASTTYLVISYTSDGENKFVMLDTAASGTFALKLQKDFKRSDTSAPSSIEL